MPVETPTSLLNVLNVLRLIAEILAVGAKAAASPAMETIVVEIAVVEGMMLDLVGLLPGATCCFFRLLVAPQSL